jgi:hypothetical protein
MEELSPAQRAWWELSSYCRVLWQALYNSPIAAEVDGECARMADAMARRGAELGISAGVVPNSGKVIPELRTISGYWSPVPYNSSHRPSGDSEDDGA